MGLNVLSLRVCEKSLDEGLHLRAIDEIGVEHETSGIEGTQAKRPYTQHFGYFADAIIRFERALAHEDRMTCTVRRVGVLVNVIEQESPLAWLEIAQLDAVRKAGLGVCDIADNALSLEFGVAQAEEVCKGGRR